MIVAVCLNPALDVTYRVAALAHGTAHAVDEVWLRPGGKGTNVARVLVQLGERVMLVAPHGGTSGASFVAALAEADVPYIGVPIAEQVRTCVAVVDHDATVFNEPGPVVSAAEWAAIVEAVEASVQPGDVMVLSGSVPRGVPADACAQLVRLAHAQGARVVVDAKGAALADALTAGPDLVAPNEHEAADLLGITGPLECATELVRRGALAAVVSAGARGVFARSGTQAWRAVPPVVVDGNPTGAGDALTAALAAGLHADLEWTDVLRDAVAVAGGAVACDVAGEIDLTTRAALVPEVAVEHGGFL